MMKLAILLLTLATLAPAQELVRVDKMTISELTSIREAQEKVQTAQRNLDQIKAAIAHTHDMDKLGVGSWLNLYPVFQDQFILYYENSQEVYTQNTAVPVNSTILPLEYDTNQYYTHGGVIPKP